MSDKKTKKDEAIDELLNDIELNNDALKEAVETASSEEGGEENVELLKNVLEETQNNIRRALDVIASSSASVSKHTTNARSRSAIKDVDSTSDADEIIEGVFNGEGMVGSNGREYSIPPNYASKSKLVEGDILKLTITKDGSFIYKQIGPIEREKLKAVLLQDEITGDWYAVSDSRRWKLLTASITYFRGQPGDDVVILVPKNSKSLWAAVENIIKK